MIHELPLTRWVALAAVLASVAPAQEPPAQEPPAQAPLQQEPLTRADFDVRRPPRGTVVDQAGQPIKGATVQIRIEPDGLDGVSWRNQLLRRQPLPAVASGRDGEFFLPLTDLHRLLSRQTAGSMSLVVEHPDHHPWIEPLTSGLQGYLGSRVVLAPVRDADRLRVVVADPKPGMWVSVHRRSAASAPHIDLERWYPVPESGVVEAVVSWVPSPAVHGTLNTMTLPIAVDVQLLYPGRSSAPVHLGYGQREVRLGAAPGGDLLETVCALVRSDGAPFAAPRGLYRCRDGELRWFPVDPKNVVQSPYLSLVAVEDSGCLAVHVPFIDPSKTTIPLDPMPAGDGRVLVLRGADKQVVEEAEVSFFDLAALPERLEASRLGHLRARRRLMVRDGRIELSEASLPGPGFLLVHVPGFAPKVLFEPRRIAGTEPLDLGRPEMAGQLELTAVDEEGRPVVGAYVVMNSHSFKLGAFGRRLLRTDRTGKVVVPHLPTGNHVVQVVGQGLTAAYTSVRINADDQAVSRQLKVARSAEYCVQLVDEQDQPAPFGAVRVYAVDGNRAAVAVGGMVRTNSSLCADSLGRILLSDYSAAMTPQVVDLFSLVPRANEPLDGSAAVARVRVGAVDSVVMPLPGAETTVTKESLQIAARTSSRAVPSAEGCALLVARFPRGMPAAVLSVYLRGQAPLRLGADAVAAALREQKERPVTIDQRQLARKVRFTFGGLEDVKVDEFRLELAGLNFANAQPYIYGDSGLRVRRDETGQWSVGLRDRGAFTARVLHPDFLMKAVDVPEAQGADPEAPLDVELERGTPVRFRIRSRTKLNPSSLFYLHVHTPANAMLLYQSETLGAAMREVGKNEWELRVPVALEPGQYRFTLRVRGSAVNMPRRTCTVPETGELLISVDDGNVRLGSNPWAEQDPGAPADLAREAQVAAMETSIKLLKGRIAALTDLKGTDEKSRERLESKRKSLEKRLAALEEALQKIKPKQAKDVKEGAPAAQGPGKEPPQAPVRRR